MPLPVAPPSAGLFYMGGGTELARARVVPSADRLPRGKLQDAARDVRRAVKTWTEIHAAGRALLDSRAQVHADDQRAASRAMGAGKAFPEAKLYDHDAELADTADRLNAAAGAVAIALGALESLPADVWESAASRIEREVAEQVGAAENALATARAALESVGDIAGVRAFTRGRATMATDPFVAQAIDAVDRATEAASIVRDGEPAPDANLISAPVHAGMSSAYAQATAPVIPGA